jgi:ACS family D-galactonate transporter-like MFS transporter
MPALFMTTTSTPERKRLSGSLIAVLVLLGISVFINYIDRGNLSIAAPLLKAELKITPAQLGLLLSAFFWTYACLQPIYGWLVDRFSVYWMLAAGYCLWSLATAVTGFVHVFAVLFVFRLIVGMGEAVSFPAYSKIIALNYPEEHRGLANAVVAAGLSIGPGFGMLLGGTLMARFGWRPFFIVLGFASLVWLPAWIKWMPRTNVVPPANSASAPSLWEFLSLRSAWGTCIGVFCGNYLNYFMLTWLPYYLVREQHFSMPTMAKIGGAGYLLSAACATISGSLSDRWIQSGATPTRVRKTFSGVGIAMAGIFLGLCSIAPLHQLCVALLWLGMGCFGVSSSNVWAISQTLAGPQAAGRWVGFQNCIANIAGVVVPVFTGFVLARTGHFYWAFAIVTAVALTGSMAWFFIVGRVEQVAWGKYRPPLLAKAAAE